MQDVVEKSLDQFHQNRVASRYHLLLSNGCQIPGNPQNKAVALVRNMELTGYDA